jgi:hypothetical protein
MPTARLPAVVVAMLALAASGGCHVLMHAVPDAGAMSDLEAAAARRPAPPAPLELEVVFLRHEPRDPFLGAALWDLVDEQAIDEGTRRRLAANGLRGGVVTAGLPAPLAERLEAAAREPALDAPGTLRVLRLLPGRRAEVMATSIRPDLIVLEHDGESVRGATYHDASGLVALRAWPAPDGRVRIEAVPEFKHGPARRTWVGEEGAFRLETGQGRRRLDQLGLSVELPARGLLVIGCTPDAPSSVGEALLQERQGAAGAMRQLLVISPRHVTVDPLFASPAPDPDDQDDEGR